MVQHKDLPDFLNRTNNRPDEVSYIRSNNDKQVSFSNVINKEKIDPIERLISSRSTGQLNSILEKVDKYKYHFLPVNFYFAEFRLDLFLSKHNNLFDNKLHHFMHEENILFFYKGDFSQGKFISIFNSLQRLKKEKGINKKMLYIFIEMFQNIIKHSSEQNEKKIDQ